MIRIRLPQLGAALRALALAGPGRAAAVLLAAALTASPAAPPAAAQEAGYRLRAGDVLRIEVLEDPGLNRAALVAPDGRITLPLAGAVAAGGRTVEAVQADIAARLAPNFAAPPTVYVALDRLAERRAGGGGSAAAAGMSVFVVGEAAKPGRLALRPGTTVLQAFAEMGGFSRFAATRRIELRRTDPRSGAVTRIPLDWRAIEAGTSAAGGTVLRDGDVIIVPQRRLFE